MVRSLLLKYYFQLRLGDMDGLFIVYHNIAKIFGFQYMASDEIVSYLFENQSWADLYFLLTLRVVDDVFGYFINRGIISTSDVIVVRLL